MKVKITYQKWENTHAQRIADFIQREFPGAKVRKSNAYAPIFHTYLTVKIPNNSSVDAVFR